MIVAVVVLAVAFAIAAFAAWCISGDLSDAKQKLRAKALQCPWPDCGFPLPPRPLYETRSERGPIIVTEPCPECGRQVGMCNGQYERFTTRGAP